MKNKYVDKRIFILFIFIITCAAVFFSATLGTMASKCNIKELFPVNGGYINRNGQWVIQPKFRIAYQFFDGLAAVQLSEASKWYHKWTYIDTSGHIVINDNHIFLWPVLNFSDGIAAALIHKNPDLFVILTKTSTSRIKISTPIQGVPTSTSEGVVVFKRICKNEKGIRTKKYGVIDRKGNIIVKPTIYCYIGPFSEGLAGVAKLSNKKLIAGYINLKGQIVIPCKYRNPAPFSDGLAAVKILNKGHKYTLYINHCGHVVLDLKKFVSASSFHEGLAKVSRMLTNGERYGFIDRVGNMRIPLKFTFAGSFHEGLALAAIGDRGNAKYGYINHGGKWVIEPKFKVARNFNRGMAFVTTEKLRGYVNRQGNWVWKTTEK